MAAFDGAGRSVYFGCASYKDDSSRKGENVHKVRSFWLDIDCGEGKPYATQRAGLIALTNFKKSVGLPTPLIVSSGNGLHVYWPMDRDLDPEEWRPVASLLRQVTRAEQLEVDPSRTADIASVLRPVGTHHRKGEPKPVAVLRDAEQTDFDAFKAQLEQHITSIGLTPDVGRAPPATAVGNNSDLSGGLGYKPANGRMIAEKCAVLREMRDTKGDIEQPLWYASLAVLHGCEDGEALAQEWSNGHKDYSEEETASEFARAGLYPPTTCARFAALSPSCESCPFKGEIHSPIKLGYGAVETQKLQLPVASDPEAKVEVELPSGFRWSNSRGTMCLQQMILDADGESVPVPFCDTLFYAINRISTEDGYVMELEMYVRESTRRFQIPCSTVAEGGKSLASALGRYEIVAHPKQKPMIDAYLARWMDRLRNTAEEINTYRHFGWYEQSFLVGNTLITPNAQRTVLLRGNAAIKSKAFVVRGSYDEWKRIIDTAYNYPGQEALQYMVVASFAAPLFAMFKSLGGVTVYAHSEGTGVGKTTAQRAGLSAWGNWSDLQLAEGKTTANALWGTIGTYCNLPVLFDELTNQSNSQASEIVFSISSGRDKQRLKRDGTLQESHNNWSTITMASGNNLLTEKLSIHRSNAEAELSRLFEFTVNTPSRLSPNEAADLFPRLLDNYGHGGLEFMQYVVNNYADVETSLFAIQKAFNTEAGINQGERYWSALQASVLTALLICRKLGILKFDAVALKAWIMSQTTRNRTQRQESVNDPLEQFGKMLADVWQGILVTNGEGDLRKNLMAEVIQHPRGQMTGRVINAMDNNEKTVLLLNNGAVREWCNKKGASAKEMFDAVHAAGWAELEQVRYSLGRGTAQYSHVSSQVRCWVVDLHKAGAETRDHQIAQRLKLVASTGSNDAAATGS